MPFPEQVAPGGILVYPQIQSPNFSLADQTGWAILSNGDAYFFDITATGSVTANTVVVAGSGDGVFIYDGIPAYGNLILAISSAAGTDAYGNQYSGPGIAISAPGSNTNNEIQLRPDKSAILIYAYTA
jgi:hypothetical protein